MKLVYSDDYEVDLGAHPFITAKYRLIKEQLINEKLAAEDKNFVSAPAVPDKDILLVHTNQYLKKIKSMRLSLNEILTLEIPLTEEIVNATMICCGGTILACQHALDTGTGIHIGGGFHHAFPDHGEGFCIFNDMAIAIKKLHIERKIKRSLVIDCDLHQGNGTAHIFRNDKTVFTFSIHEEDIYPACKPASDLDIGLSAGTDDREYMDKLKKYLPAVIEQHKPALILYQAGADPYKGDQIGNLQISIEGLKQRDELVCNLARSENIPVAVVLGGGYAAGGTDDTVKIHTNTVKAFLENGDASN